MRDKMGIVRNRLEDVPDYRSLYLIKLGKCYNSKGTTINEYGASDDTDIELLPLLSGGGEGSAAPGSTCRFNSGKLFILGNEKWDLYNGPGRVFNDD